ncbi:alkaline phosphatase family protein [Paenibacillus sp. OV219]|uniref:alkaline phosphatase family protein n=1 Tax=Paenibacillus sp. OV219 TaxID=1884377 RepID=UPI0008C6CC18|nr:alkaline phosphatase family protein [Paenibacillus sp. OV219]SEM54326.1 acid phosphatase [Paenibacillus sp. OV219]
MSTLPIALTRIALTAISLTIISGCSWIGEEKKLSPISSESSDIPNATTTKEENTSKQLAEVSVEHIVIVVEENHSYKQIVGSSNAPYMNALIKQGALFTSAYAITHPSQPNYLALFSGSTQGLKDDGCHKPFRTDNLGAELLKSGLTFTGFSEDMPKTGFTGCWAGGYGRKHNPWVQFSNIPAKLNKPYKAFPKDYSKLPNVSFVIPNHQNDMHDGTVKEADDWLKTNIRDYAKWAQTHQSLLIVTWDEDDFSKKNQIPIIMVGSMIKPGKSEQRINHYSVLRMIEEMYDIPLLGGSRTAAPIEGIWK